jgi:glyoxylase-like metal-dependent hydrolase (beta-lactamase superfamily II)
MAQTIHRFEVGHFRCTAIADADQGARNLLLVEGKQRILIDTGVGVHHPDNPGRLMTRLEEAGVEAASIEAVILSHADFDHIGGATDGSRRAFPDAEHSILRAEVEFWKDRPTRLMPSPLYDEVFRSRVNTIPPVALDALGATGLHLVDGGWEIATGVTMIAAPGHTPGNAIVRIESEGEILLSVADLFYQPENLVTEGWVSQYDYDPKVVVGTRRRVLDQAASDRSLLMAYHLPFPGLGRVHRTGSAWQWVPGGERVADRMAE